MLTETVVELQTVPPPLNCPAGIVTVEAVTKTLPPEVAFVPAERAWLLVSSQFLTLIFPVALVPTSFLPVEVISFVLVFSTVSKLPLITPSLLLVSVFARRANDSLSSLAGNVSVTVAFGKNRNVITAATKTITTAAIADFQGKTNSR